MSDGAASAPGPERRGDQGVAKRKKKNSILGLDLGTQAVKAVEMTRNGEELAVTGCSYEHVEESSKYDQAIKAVIEAGAFNVKRVAIGFSGRSTLLQHLTLPGDRSDDLEVAVMEEAEKYIPYDISEAQIDYHVFESENTRQIKVLMVAVRQQDIEDKLEVLFSAGIKPILINAELIALANAMETANSGGHFIAEGKAVGLVDFGASKTLITVTDGVNHVFREFPVGGINITEMVSQRVGCDMIEAERMKVEPGDKMDLVKDAIYPGIEDITAEIRACIDNFKGASGGKEVELILLSGGLVGFSGVTPLIGRLARVEARIFDSFGAVDASELDAEFIGTHAHEFSVAFGLACHARD